MARIAIDLDDTLVPTIELLIKEIFKANKTKWFKGYHSLEDLSFEERDAFYKYIRQTLNNQDIKKFKPIPGAKTIIRKLIKDHELYIITGRTIDVKNHTHKWVKEYFPNTFKEIIFSEYYKSDDFVKDKGELCKEYGIDLIVDDNKSYIMDCYKHNIKTIVFDYKKNYPWSKSKYPNDIKIANDWKQVYAIIKNTKF
jgi:5'(3')-deoxyribonucleotidase